MFVYNSWGKRLPGYKIPDPSETVDTIPNWLHDAIKAGHIRMYKNADNKVHEATIVHENGYQRVRPNEWIVRCDHDDFLKMDNSSVLDGFKSFG